MVKRFPMFAVVLLAASTLFAFDEPIRRTLIVRDGNVIFDDDGLAGKLVVNFRVFNSLPFLI